jgi:hypothetical protein
LDQLAERAAAEAAAAHEALLAERAAKREAAAEHIDTLIPDEVLAGLEIEEDGTYWRSDRGGAQTADLDKLVLRLRPNTWRKEIGELPWLYLWATEDGGESPSVYLSNVQPGDRYSAKRLRLTNADQWANDADLADIVAAVYAVYNDRVARHDAQAEKERQQAIASARRTLETKATWDWRGVRYDALKGLNRLKEVDPDRAAEYDADYAAFIEWADKAQAEEEAEAAKKRAAWDVYKEAYAKWDAEKTAVLDEYARALQAVAEKYNREYKVWTLEYGVVATDDDLEEFITTDKVRVTDAEGAPLTADTVWHVLHYGTILDRRFAHPVSLDGPEIRQSRDGYHPTVDISPLSWVRVSVLPTDEAAASADIQDIPRPDVSPEPVNPDGQTQSELDYSMAANRY